ncbi:hypothetical protein J2X02_002101 [Pseudoxanthomonas japonensis]|uniref:hypothetical protein n=1 Tax=Pseudoxanthomonas japonensis TaxID=69284 RepID=UPI00285CBDAD|nr:hypothetical protein [Pseudoxanthomonas japonensis]MDR7069250.1 hypothetical protein [Pseudoxanthomonas japonensis]
MHTLAYMRVHLFRAVRTMLAHDAPRQCAKEKAYGNRTLQDITRITFASLQLAL